ncbi:MAG: hypothetical protein UZ15_CFX003003482 [Chloroflexi bacterium OLB15]|nr:MAG: hypothetical protein UZ15_CFX003003482 [Chloroflexi bacterium OLB15]
MAGNSANGKAAETTVEDAKHAVEDAAEQVNEQLAELGRSARKKADEAKGEAVKGLNNIAETIRREAREAGADDDALKSADAVAANLEKAAQYLKKNSYEDIREDVEERVKENTFMLIGIVFVVGLVLGLILRGGGNRR